MSGKPLVWLGHSREAITAFPEDVRKIAGFQLWRVHRGLEPNDWKPMASVGLGVQEIRSDLDLARQRLRQLMHERARRNG